MILVILLISQYLYSFDFAYADDNFPYSAACKKFGLKRPKPHLEWDAATGVGYREKYEIQGMKLHEQGKWKDSNCLLIYALNISTDHSLNLLNTVGFNYAALGNDAEALKYFDDATGFTWDLDGWLEHKARPPFDKILSNPIYKSYEQSLYDYYKENDLPIPKY
jgi:hypothetical protein